MCFNSSDYHSLYILCCSHKTSTITGKRYLGARMLSKPKNSRTPWRRREVCMHHWKWIQPSPVCSGLFFLPTPFQAVIENKGWCNKPSHTESKGKPRVPKLRWEWKEGGLQPVTPTRGEIWFLQPKRIQPPKSTSVATGHLSFFGTLSTESLLSTHTQIWFLLNQCAIYFWALTK